MAFEPFEERVLLAVDGPVLLAVIPATGTVVEQGTILREAPRQLLLRFDSSIDSTSLGTPALSSIQFKRGGDHVLNNADDVSVTPGFIGIGDNPFDVIVRFDQNLPDDLYQMTIVGAGTAPLRDTTGKAFNNGQNLNRTFSLDLGAQVVAVVPQPITHDASGLRQSPNTIEVYFNVNDPLNVASAEEESFYQLIRTQGTATTTDDGQIINPTSVSYSATTGKAVLTFPTNELMMVGTYRLRIGTKEPLALAPVMLTPAAAGTDFANAAPLGTGGNPFTAALGTQTVQLSDVIGSVAPLVLFPGSPQEPGERYPEIESHVALPTNTGDLPILQYNFKSDYGIVLGQPVFNNITEPQKQRVREVFSYYASYLGVDAVETVNSGMTIVTGDVRALSPNAPPTGIGGIADTGNYQSGRAIMNSLVDWGASEAGGSYFQTAMHEIGHLLGLGHDYAAPAITVMGTGGEKPLGTSLAEGEPVFPGDLDLIYARYIWPALGNDINVYTFNVSNAGQLNIEAFAERLQSLNLDTSPSRLDSVISLYDSTGKLIARNDDYYGNDSFVQLQVVAGRYYVAITSTGNTNFDPRVANSGFGGTSQGNYQLRLSFTPTPPATDGIRDQDNQTGTRLDGDRDGLAGGVSNFWFKIDTAHTLYVDKAAAGGTGPLGTLENPYTTISNALAAASSGYIVRIIGNGVEGDIPVPVADRLSYNVGFNSVGQPLSDGSTFNVPRGVTVMIDAGAIIKLRGANIDVGSSAQGIDRSAGALQVLGTTATKTVNGQVVDVGSVYFTSYYNNAIGDDAPAGTLAKGNWGGLVFRNDSDLESAGIFLNYVNHAKLSYGGGQVSVNSVLSVFDAIHLETSRPTITYNTITNSADSAISGDPNSFEESEFVGPGYHADYSRVGPRVYGNVLSENSINGLFIRIRTLNGRPLDPLTVNARLANTDIVHVLNEVLLIQGRPGGYIIDASGLHARPNARLALDPGIVLKMSGARIETEIGADFIAEGTIDRPIILTSVFDDRFGGSGTSDTTNDGSGAQPAQGNWSGMFFGPLSSASIDHALVAYGGGTSSIEGGFDQFEPVEIHQAHVRITNSTFDQNAASGGGERNGRSPSDASVIFIRGAQPVILNNTIQNNSGAAMSVNVNALNSQLVDDWGRSRGGIDLQGSFSINTGPLIHNNRVGNNSVNGMAVRGGTITTNVIWDDTDIVHIVVNSIQAPNQQSLSGTLRLQSSASESLVVKVLGTNTDIIASGNELDTADRVGGTLQIVGTPNHPVVITSLKDDTVGAGLTPEGLPQKDTLNRKGVVAPEPPLLPDSGPVILDAAARDVHGSDFAGADGWDTLQFLVDYVQTTSQNKPAGRETTILYIGWSRAPQGTTLSVPYSWEAIDWVAQRLGLTVEFVGNENPSSILGVNFENYAMVYIPSHASYPLPDLRADRYENTDWWGGIEDFHLDALNRRKGDLINYVNGGGGLLVMPQDTASDPAPYAFVAEPNPFVLRKSGGNVMTATALAPTDWWPDFNIDDSWLNIGTPYRTAFKGSTGFNRLEPWAVDPVTGEIAMLGLKAGGRGLGAPHDIVTPGDWGSIRLDALSNDRNVEIINETERNFTSAGDTNQLPSTAQFLGELAKDQASGDDNVRLGFEIHGGLSQATNSPGGADVDVYSFRATAGTRVWFDIDRTASALDSVVELVDANGAVVARSDNSVPESSGAQATVGIARPMEPGTILGSPSPFALPDFYTSNPKDAGMRLDLPGTSGTVNTYFVRVRSGSTNLSNLTGGLTKGAYVLQLRLQQVDEFPGSTVRYSDIRYATNGIEVIGKPENSPLLSTTAEINRQQFGLFFNQQFGTVPVPGSTELAQDLGNLLDSAGTSIGVGGELTNALEVDWYSFVMSYAQIQSIGGLSDGLSSFATMLRINYADGLVRPDTTLSLYDESGTLLLVARDSEVVDALPRPNTGTDSTNLAHGSYGQKDPTLGPVQLPTGAPGNPVRFFVAVSSARLLPQALSATYTASTSLNPLIRLEPIDGIKRISEDRFFVPGFSTAQTPTQLFPSSTSAGLNQFADPYQLGDVALFINTFATSQQGTVTTRTSRLRLADPFTGAQLNSPTNAPVLQLPTLDEEFGYFDIAMRNDGRLYSLTQGDGLATSGNYVEFNTGSGQIINADPGMPLDDGLETYIVPPADPPMFQADNLGVQFEALAFLQSDNSTFRRLYAIGNHKTPNPGAGIATDNMLFELNPNTGQALFPPEEGSVWDDIPTPSGTGTNFVPIGHFNVNGTVKGMTIVGNQMFVITDMGTLYRVNGFQVSDRARDIATVTQVGQVTVQPGADITGLTGGPLHVEGGAYANTLFAIDDLGGLYAFNATAVPAPVFVDGRSFISTGISGAQGLTFSTLDYNLWHTTITRATDDGHGVDQAYDNNIARDPGGTTPPQFLVGGGSFYFGLEPVAPTNPFVTIQSQPGARAYDTNPDLFSTYGLPGGAYGSVTSNTFSLEGYTAGDQPVLYFNYLLDTGDVNSTSNGALDVMRVLVSPDGVNWKSLATSNVVLGSGAAENPLVLTPSGGAYNGFPQGEKQHIQGLFESDEPGATDKAWRQARVDLGDFAGQSNLRLRFQFSTAGTMGSGNSNQGTGAILQALAGSQLRDGETFVIDSTTFTFRSGFALNVPAGGGAIIADGETLTINGTKFEFNKVGGVTSGSTAIQITNQDTAEEVAQAIGNQLQPLNLSHKVFFSRIEVPGATSILQSASPAIVVQGAALPTGSALKATDVPINGNMTSTQVAEAIADALDRVFTAGFALTVGAGANIVDGQTLTVNGTTFEFNKTGGVSGTNTPIPITDLQSAQEVAQSITTALSALFPNTRQVGSQVEVPDALTLTTTSPVVVVFRHGTDASNIFTSSKLSRDQLRIFGHSIVSSGPLPSSSSQLPGDSYGRFTDPSRDRHQGTIDGVAFFEGVYIDDIIVGFASRGEMVTGALPQDTNFTAVPTVPGAPTSILSGLYQLQIGSTDYYDIPQFRGDVQGHIFLADSFNVNDRFARGFTLLAPPASQIFDGQTFRIDDGFQALTFEFDTNGQWNQNNQRVAVANGNTAAQVAVAIRNAINSAVANLGFKVRASTTISPPPQNLSTGNRIDLFDAIEVEAGGLGLLTFGVPGGVTTTGRGDVLAGFDEGSLRGAAGQTIIFGNSVSDSRQVGIQAIPLIGQIRETAVAFTVLSTFPTGAVGDTGGIARLPTLNTRGWIPGVTIKNNLVAVSGRTGIQVGGDPNASYAYAQAGDKDANFFREVELFLPFVRVVNNTVYDARNGIAATNTSSPTIINNIIANSGVAVTPVITTKGAAVYVDDSSGGPKAVPAGLTIRFGDTVVGANLYQNNAFNVLGTGDTNAIILPAGSALFVDASKRNFYPAEGSLAIDSSVNSVQERGALQSATSPLGMPPSPIQAPDTDLLGQLRVDDPFVPTPPGLGSNVFKDRGALERADFIGPTAAMDNPVDNDSGGIDRNPLPNQLLLVNAQLTDFSIELVDGLGAGIDDSTVNISKFTIDRDGTPLVRNVDYVLAYDTNSKLARLLPAQGIWLNGTYTITVENTILDLAGNNLQPNVPPNTQFVIQLTDSIVSPWQNPDNKVDVNRDGIVSGLDLLLIINRLLAGQGGVLPLPAVVPPYVDVSGDGSLTPLDALQVINFILSANSGGGSSLAAAPQGGDEQGVAPAVTVADSNSVAVGLAMSQPESRSELEEDDSWWAPSAGSTEQGAAPTVAAAQMQDAHDSGALAATMEPDELDALHPELDSILTDLTGDFRQRLWV